MHKIVHQKLDGGVGLTTCSSSVLALMTGSGFGWDAGAIAREASKRTGVPEALASDWATAIGQGGLTMDEALELCARYLDTTEGYSEHIIVDESLLPYHLVGNADERYFRPVMVYDNTEPSGCRCDMSKARDLHMDAIRVVRNTELVKEDINMLKAIEAGDTSAQSTVATKKQVLRDLPATFDITTDAGTPELLKAKWPSELPARG